jgi:hypothetical protein
MIGKVFGLQFSVFGGIQVCDLPFAAISSECFGRDLLNTKNRTPKSSRKSKSLNRLCNVSFRHCFRHFTNGHLSQVPANQGFANRLNARRTTGFSLFLAHSSDSSLQPKMGGRSVSVNRPRNALFRHSLTPFGPPVIDANHCMEGTCDKCKPCPFDGITSWFTPISGSPTGAFVPFVAEPTQN